MISKQDVLQAHKDEAEAHWMVMTMDQKIEQLQQKRRKAYDNWMKCKDRIRFIRDEPEEAFIEEIRPV